MTVFPFNRLLDYRSLDQLMHMQESGWAVLLAEILRQPASETTWRALWELFAASPTGQAKTQNLDTALKSLDAWPDKLRLTSSTNSLLYEGNGLSPLARMVRSMDVYRREQNGSAELSAIVSSEYVDGLCYLSIIHSEIDDHAWQALAESQHLSNLRQLHISKTLLGASDIKRLFASDSFPRLQCIELIDAGVRPERIANLAHLERFPELSAIDLSSNALSDDGTEMLSQLPEAPQVRRLSLRDNFIGARGIRMLISSPFCKSLQQLDVTGNRVTDLEKKELTALAASKNIILTI
jgi:Leucine-rich repeat (LRR) protein